MTVAATPPAPEIPDVDLATFTLSRAAELGDKPALIDGPSGREISFADFAARVEALAGALAARGVGNGDVVAIYMPNLPEYAVIFHGVMRANATNTTANPLYTEGELGHQLSDSGAKMIFTIQPFLETAKAAAEHAGISDIVVVGEAEGDEPTLADLLGEGSAPPEIAIDPAIRPRRPAVLERDHRAAEGRDAHPSQPDRERPADRRGVQDHRGRRPDRRPALLPHLRADRDHEPRHPQRGDRRDDAAIRPRAVPVADRAAPGDARQRRPADRPRPGQAPGDRRRRPLEPAPDHVRRRPARRRAVATPSPSASTSRRSRATG